MTRTSRSPSAPRRTCSGRFRCPASPIQYKDKVILANDMDREDFNTKKRNDRPSVLVALDKKTGAVAWETPREAERACYSAPFFWQRPGQGEPDLVVVSTTSV